MKYISATMLLLTMMLMSCSVQYKFNGASIDYSKTKTIQINDFPIRSNYVWGPMANVTSRYQAKAIRHKQNCR